jgi:hypothetical protein
MFEQSCHDLQRYLRGKISNISQSVFSVGHDTQGEQHERANLAADPWLSLVH